MKNKDQLKEEMFKAIAIDRDNKNFKVISGDYKDKKALSDTYIDDYIIRKVYKKEVFEWILKNAKNSLDAYILLSTSYKKWVNKDITRNYYHKIRKDLPVLTYEESTMEKFVKNLIQEAADNIETDDLLDVDLNEPLNSFVDIFVKGPLGNKKDNIQVTFPVDSPDIDNELDAMYASEEVQNAVAQLRQKYPNVKFIYYQLPGQKPQEYIEM